MLWAAIKDRSVPRLEHRDLSALMYETIFIKRLLEIP